MSFNLTLKGDDLLHKQAVLCGDGALLLFKSRLYGSQGLVQLCKLRLKSLIRFVETCYDLGRFPNLLLVGAKDLLDGLLWASN
jgi:hypothetical protein